MKRQFLSTAIRPFGIRKSHVLDFPRLRPLPLAMSSAPMSPVTNDSTGGQSRRTSTPPSSPPTESPDEMEKKPQLQHEMEVPRETNNGEEEDDDDDDDDEDMGTKAKALTNLLKTSSVCLHSLTRHN